MEAAANIRGDPAVSDAANIFTFLADQMADHDTTWSLGTFGAIAEFTRDPDEPVTLRRGDAVLAAVTARGAIRIEAGAGVRLFASESTTRESWNQRVAACLPEGRCATNRRTVLTPLGLDLDALREQDRDSPLFDLGLGALQVDLCVRVADSSVAAQLMVVRRTAVVRAWKSGDEHDPRRPAPRIRESRGTHRGLPADSSHRREKPGRTSHPARSA
jgi:Family of unknown function (DUF6925)